MKKLAAISLLSIFLAIPFPTFAHPGRTDSSGCHTCRTNCPNWGLSHGEYHCHRSKGISQPLEPVKSTRGVDGGAGYVSPAPEYKVPAIKHVNQSQTQPTIVTKVSFMNRIFSWLGWR